VLYNVTFPGNPQYFTYFRIPLSYSYLFRRVSIFFSVPSPESSPPQLFPHIFLICHPNVQWHLKRQSKRFRFRQQHSMGMQFTLPLRIASKQLHLPSSPSPPLSKASELDALASVRNFSVECGPWTMDHGPWFWQCIHICV